MLRAEAFALKPREIGLSPAECPPVWGLILELGFSDTVASLVVLSDGSVSVYLSDGGGVIGCGLHPDVRRAALKMLLIAQGLTSHCRPTSDHPLPYDMGRMLRKGDWNNGVLPSPFPTNGVELNGTHWIGDIAQLDYAAYAVMGFKNDTDTNPTDLNFQESHLPYYLTSDPRPASGARLALTLKTGQVSDMTLGASGLLGTYDPENKLTYAIIGGDFSLRIQRTALRIEYLVRRQQFNTNNPDIFRYAIAPADGDFFAKHGAYVELEHPVAEALAVIGRVDGMYRVGNVSNLPVGSTTGTPVQSPLTFRSSVIRETLGLALALERNFRLKGSVELWQFSYADAVGRETELSFHLGAVGSF